MKRFLPRFTTIEFITVMLLVAAGVVGALSSSLLTPAAAYAQVGSATTPAPASAPAATQAGLNCIPVSNDVSGTMFSGVLVRPRIILSAGHVELNYVGKPFRWVDDAGTVVSATPIAQIKAEKTDLRFIILDKAPPGIRPATIYTGPVSNLAVRWCSPLRTWYDGNALHKFNTWDFGWEVGIVRPASGLWITPYVGCSGCPVFTADGGAKLVGTWHTTNACTSLGDYVDVLDRVEETLTAPIAGDFNGDGSLDSRDYQYWLTKVGTPHPEGNGKVWDLEQLDALVNLGVKVGE